MPFRDADALEVCNGWVADVVDGKVTGMTPRQIVQSKSKFVVLAVGAAACAVICALIVYGHASRPMPGVFGMLAFLALAILGAFRAARPERLSLDDIGFTRSGGLLRTSVRVEWRETTPFTVGLYGKTKIPDTR